MSQGRGAAAAVLVGPQGGVSRRSAASRPTTTASTARFRARALPRVLRADRRAGRRSTACACANVFHAGDGNLHPLILFDANKPGDTERTDAFGDRILELCIEVGGTITGEHGVGVEKLDGDVRAVRAPPSSRASSAIKAAFDPHGLLNPGKAVPTLHRCAEFGRMHVHHGELRASGAAALLTRSIDERTADPSRPRPTPEAVAGVVDALTARLRRARGRRPRAIREQHGARRRAGRRGAARRRRVPAHATRRSRRSSGCATPRAFRSSRSASARRSKATSRRSTAASASTCRR